MVGVIGPVQADGRPAGNGRVAPDGAGVFADFEVAEHHGPVPREAGLLDALGVGVVVVDHAAVAFALQTGNEALGSLGGASHGGRI